MKKILVAVLLVPLFAGLAAADTKEEPKPQSVKFELVPSGHFIVKVKLNGHGPYNLIFDTGAPSTLITPKVAQEAGLVQKAKDKPLIPLFGMMGQRSEERRVGKEGRSGWAREAK